MAKINLNTKESVVDLLKSKGEASDFASRKTLAEKSGISGYDGSAAKNIELMGKINKPSSSIITNQTNIIKTTTPDRNKINSSMSKLDDINRPNISDSQNYTNNIDNKEYKSEQNAKFVNVNTPEETTIQDAKGNKFFSSMPEDSVYQLPELTTEGSKWVFDSKGKAYEMDVSGNLKSNVLADQEYNKVKQINNEIQQQNEIFEKQKANLDASHQLLLDRIKETAEKNRRDTEILNKKYLGAKTVAGFRTGATEYTPEIQMGVLKNEEEEGIRRLQDIDDNMNLLVAEAIAAKEDKDLMLVQEKFNQYQTLQKRKNEEVQNLYKTYLENQKYIRDTLKAKETEERAKNDQALQELKVSAPQLAKDYASATDKDKWVNDMVKSTGLTRENILGAITTAIGKPKTSGGSSKQTQAEIKSNAIGEMATGFNSKKGSDGFVDPYLWKAARARWSEEGLNDADFIKNFKQYLNPESYSLVPEFKKKVDSGRDA